MTVEATETRTYGNYRRPRSAGIGNLGLFGMTVMVGGLIVVVLTMMAAGAIPALCVLVAGGLFLGTLNVRGRHGRTMLQGGVERVAWARTKMKGEHRYRSGPTSQVPSRKCQLPGVAASTQVTEHEDLAAQPFAMIHWPSTRHYTVTLSSEPDGASLVDEDQVDHWVAHYGKFLSQLCDEPGLVGASVTIETAPDTGARLRRELERSTAPDAPAIARQMLAQVADTYPAGSAMVRAMTALTFTAAGRGATRTGGMIPGSPRLPEQVARDLAYRVHAFGTLLEKSGAGATRPMSVQALAETVWTAYDPAAAPVFAEARAAGVSPAIEWDNVGPAAHEARWDHYRHDSGTSVTWAMTQAPRGEVMSGVLSELVKPHRDIARKRVTMLYRPVDKGRAAIVVERDKRNADFRASSGRPSARAQADQDAAHATAEEEARGAGLVDFGMLATATVLDPEKLDHARHAIEQLAPAARVQFRPVYGSQDSAFAACLPIGLVIPAHLRIPTSIRETV